MDKKGKFIIVFLLMIGVFVYSAYVRFEQYNKWKEQRSIYFVENYPAMTTLDAYYWLRYAKEYDNGLYYKTDNDTLRYYPDETEKPRPVPFLSFLIAKLSSFTNNNYYYAGLFLIPILASLFIIPFSLYFYYAGFPFGGIIGSFIGTFSYMYFVRSSMGRVDTDLLNIFFPALASLFIFFAAKKEDTKKVYLYSALSGLCMLFFYWWYYHPGFTLIYFGILLVVLFLKKKPIKVILKSAGLFVLFSNPLYLFYGIFNLFGFIINYFTVSKENVIGFPNILQTITEAQHKPIKEVLEYIINSPYLSILGLIIFVIFAALKWRKFLAIVPLFLLGLLAFKSSNRFVMFLAPFAGAGIGMIIDYAVEYAEKNFKKIKPLNINLIAVAIVVLLCVGLGKLTAKEYVPKPSINPGIIKSFIDMIKKLEKGAIWSWWDYGYAIEDIVGFPVYHDGGSQGSPKTYFIAKSLITDNQSKLYKYISYFDNNGMNEIKEMIDDNKSAPDIVKYVDSYEGLPKGNNYVLFTMDMISKFPAYNFIGSYNFNTKTSQEVVVVPLRCQKVVKGVFECDGNSIDTKNGLINGKIPVKMFDIAKNGKLVSTKKYPFNTGYNVELLLKGNTVIYIILSDDNFYKSNFNQMYLLGKYDKKLFEEVYNNFPFARVFKVKK